MQLQFIVCIGIIFFIKCTDGHTITLGVLVPHSGSRSFGYEVEMSVKMALKKIENNANLTYLHGQNITFDYIVADTQCDIGQGLFELVQKKDLADVFIGPACDSLCEPAGLLAGKWNKPMISYSCALEHLNDRTLFPTFARTTGLYADMDYTLVDLVNHYNWDRVTIINGAELIWRQTATRYQIENNANLTYLHGQNITFDYIVADTQCDIGQGLFELVQKKDLADVFIGPACDSLCEPAGLLAGKWNKPMISYSCALEHLNDRTLFPTFARTTGLYADMDYTLVDLVNHYNWDRVTIINGAELIWRQTATRYQNVLTENGVWTDILSITTDDPHQILQDHLIRAAEEAKVFIICAYGLDVIYVMCAAQTGNLLNGDNAFIAIDFAYLTKVIPTNRPCSTSDIYMNGLLDITIGLDEEYEDYQQFVRSLVQTVGGKHGPEIGIHTGMLYDAVYVYALGVNALIRDGYSLDNGTHLIKELLNHEFDGITGPVIIDSNGTRKTNFSIHNIYVGAYRTVAVTNGSIGNLHFVDDVEIYWPGGTTIPPLGRPVCGWHHELCPETNELLPVFIAFGLVLLIIVTSSSGIAFYFYRKKKKQELMESMTWKIPFTELEFKQSKSRSSALAHSMATLRAKSASLDPLNVKSNNNSLRHNSFDSNMSYGGQLFTKIAISNGIIVAVKPIRKSYVAITPALIKEINEVRRIDNRNINRLHGACIDPMKVSLLSVYCSKGSLQDVLGNDDIKLDHIFKTSFASDIAKVLSLTTAWYIKGAASQMAECKVGDISMPVFREGERDLSNYEIRASYGLLWTAPELLRDGDTDGRGTQKGDVYSYGIIIQEILLRTGPYGYMDMDADDIIDKVIEKQTPPFRPNVPTVEGIGLLDDVMRMCWEETIMFRPIFPTILLSLKKHGEGKTTNLVDQMVHMMAQYADHLEELVNERTEQLEVEQKRTEELLCRMLPRQIANDLKVGKTVEPESYDSVTIYFSDIVGFTLLSSHSSAIEIVNFLNDLYTCFDRVLETYDVYKVETIGDAYMVVSGLPVRNGIKHAGEIATMALDLLSVVTTFKIRHQPDKQLQVRIGIHSGPVCTGVVGLKMPRYCLFGDTVNYASRMESSGLALRIHVSPECRAILEELDGFYCKYRGEIEMKGKGVVGTFFLLGRQGFSKALPDLSKAAPLSEHEFK